MMYNDKKEFEELKNFRNKEGYTDPTAYALEKKEAEEHYRFKNLMQTIYYICNQAGFDITDYIHLRDRRTGKQWPDNQRPKTWPKSGQKVANNDNLEKSQEKQQTGYDRIIL